MTPQTDKSGNAQNSPDSSPVAVAPPPSTTASGDNTPSGNRPPGRSILYKILMVILSALKWVGFLVLALVTGILILVSIAYGPTHIVISLLLGLVWFGLLGFLLFGARRFQRWRVQVGAALGFLTLGLLTIIMSQVSTYTPPILDAQGKPVPGSIATLEKVRLGRSEEWLSLRGKNINNPVLLFLAGGPGASQLATARYALGGLEDYFVVVGWDQPGAGKSFDAVDRSKLTPERYISDARELALYLKQRFNQEKIYLVGESWGSALGIMLVQRYPELFHAFVGTGQMVAFTENDLLCYDFALRWAKERGDTKKVAQLQTQGPPPYYGNDVAWKQINYLMDTLNYMNQNPAIYGSGNTIRDIFSPEYGLYDKVSWIRGPVDTLNYVYPQLWNVDFRKQATHLDVPVYFLIGRHDINAPVQLTEDYYRVLEAPYKEIVWFEHSGHTPWTREPDRFVDVLVHKVLPETRNGS